jgi:hypothetical protein
MASPLARAAVQLGGIHAFFLQRDPEVAAQWTALTLRFAAV